MPITYGAVNSDISHGALASVAMDLVKTRPAIFTGVKLAFVFVCNNAVFNN